MITISLCMIVKNEERVLARCLESVGKIADEIIIVDTGSSDRTKEIAGRFTDSVYDFAWNDDFAAARNFAFSKAKMEYCLWLDADDILLPADREAFLRLKETLPSGTDVVMMRYHIAFDQNRNPTFSYYRERLVRNCPQARWKGEIHEVIARFGDTVYSEIAVTHQKEGPGDPDRNLRIFEKLRAEGKTLVPRQQFYYARELYYHARYRDAIEAFSAFLDSGEGWIENEIDACRQLSYCHRALGSKTEELRALLRSFEYAPPRAETCCDLGLCFAGREDYAAAAFWYELALTRERDDRAGGFIQPDCYGYLPCIQLCVCYDRLGDHEKAAEYNERAAAFKPDAEPVRHNRAYFAALRQQEASLIDNRDRID